MLHADWLVFGFADWLIICPTSAAIHELQQLWLGIHGLFPSPLWIRRSHFCELAVAEVWEGEGGAGPKTTYKLEVCVHLSTGVTVEATILTFPVGYTITSCHKSCEL